jgi:NAD-dependent dihydropyrimidine dehydrogenase PreA subunit
MIELVSDSRCIRCDICVRVCPTNVFEAVPNAAPIIARQDDCQTCFMCELYCPTEALFVAPDADQSVAVDEGVLQRQGLLGSYRASIGWNSERPAEARPDQTYRVLAQLQPAPRPLR